MNRVIGPAAKHAVLISIYVMLAVSALGQQRLLAIGGGERPPEAMAKFAEWAGGERSRILVITWASGVPEESFEGLKKSFAGAKVGSIEHAPIAPLDAEERAIFVSQLKQATAVFFSGGDQNRIMDVLADEELLELIRKRYRAGIPFGGTSAGAAAMSDPMMTGEADLKLLDGKQVGVRKGLGLIANVIFDQHFLIRQRHNRLFGLIMVNPKMLGIGIDEDAAVLIEDDRNLSVIGKTQVMFIHSRNGRQPFLMSVLSSGETYDLRKRVKKEDR